MGKASNDMFVGSLQRAAAVCKEVHGYRVRCPRLRSTAFAQASA